MPPVINTYGVQKKKRRGIPKFVMREAANTDVFEALKIENIKETKAIADAKKAERKKPRNAKKPVKTILHPVCTSFNADSTFDKLLSDGDWLPSCKTIPVHSSSSSDVSDLKENGRNNNKQPKLCLRSKGNGFKGVTKMRTTKVRKMKEDSIFMRSQHSLDEIPLVQRLRNNKISLPHKENLDVSNLIASDKSQCTSVPCSTPGCTPEDFNLRTCEVRVKPLSPISPICPPYGWNSTPCGKTGTGFWSPPLTLNQSVLKLDDDSYSDEMRRKVSVISLDPNKDENRILNESAESNLIISLDVNSKKSLHTAFEVATGISQENSCSPPSPDLFQSISSAPPDHAQEESCVILEEDYGRMNIASKLNVSTSSAIPIYPHVIAENTSEVQDDENGILIECAKSNLLISLDVDSKKSLDTAFEQASDISQENSCLPPSPDMFQSVLSSPPDHAQEESCEILEENYGGVSKLNVSTSDNLFDPHVIAVNTSERKVRGSFSYPYEMEHSLCHSPLTNESSENQKSLTAKQSLYPTFIPDAEPLEGSCVASNNCSRSSYCPTTEGGKQSIISEKCSRTAEICNSHCAATDLCTSLSTSIDSRSQLHCIDVTSHLDKLKLSLPEKVDHHNSSENIQSCTEVDVWSVLPEFSERNDSNINPPSSIMTVKPGVLCGKASNHNSSHAEVQTSSITSSSSTENTVPTNFNCQVVLRRCDSPAPFVPEETITSEDVETKLCVNFDCKVVLERCNIPKQPVRNSSAKFSMSRLSPNYRPSIQPETVFLKPGKQWRRSLSILSRIRLSAGEMSRHARESLSSDATKLKGKLWESSVNSVVQLQSVNDVTFEDCETSISLLSNSSGRCRLSYAGNKNDQDSVILGYGSSADSIFSRCGQDGPVSFEHYYPPTMKTCTKKIGEGVYGEVFFYSGFANRPPSVIKIIPIEGTIDVNGEPQKKFGEIFSEVCIAQELSKLRKGSENVTSCFNELLAIRCVQGCYPEWLQDLWHDYDDSKGSENDSPEVFQEDQLYIVLELQNGGKDLESFIFSSADQGLAAFKQIALTLAVGEKAIGFEHRDLHWGNVLISNTKQKSINFILDGEPISTLSKGIEVSIIDFTLSRITDPCLGRPIYFDLSCDDTLFTAEGDYQFDIYRLMKEYCGNNWEAFTPKTNIAWLHYLLDKFCTMARYKNRASKVHNKALNVLLEMKDSILMFESASRFVKCPLFFL